MSADTVLWITRMDAAGENDEDVASIGFGGEGARETLDHIRRVFRNAEQGADALAPGDLVVTLLIDGGDTSADDVDPFRIPAAQAEWFLNDWLKVPPAWRTDRAGAD